jgi:hypothetical protein
MTLDTLGHNLPVWRIAATGEPIPIDTLPWPAAGQLLPPFIADVTPQGYLGRTFALRHP